MLSCIHPIIDRNEPKNMRLDSTRLDTYLKKVHSTQTTNFQKQIFSTIIIVYNSRFIQQQQQLWFTGFTVHWLFFLENCFFSTESIIFAAEDLLSIDWITFFFSISVFLVWGFTVRWLPRRIEMNRKIFIAINYVYLEKKRIQINIWGNNKENKELINK